ncbi:MAG: DUF58 domain-containing protein, partial [Bacteroidota bacterium]
MLKRFYKSLFFSRRFYVLLVAIIFLFVLSFGIPFLFVIAQLLTLFLFLAAILDYVVLFPRSNPVSVRRECPERFSNGDLNHVKLIVSNLYPFQVSLRIIDELPDQFQRRDFFLECRLSAGETTELPYQLRPTERGEYVFHSINVFIKTPFNLLVRRKILEAEKMVKVLPSWLPLKQYELLAWSNNMAENGSKRIRKLGHSLEFEQIKEYVTGDDIRSLNWNATARKGGQLMVNK